MGPLHSLLGTEGREWGQLIGHYFVMSESSLGLFSLCSLPHHHPLWLVDIHYPGLRWLLELK